VVAIVLTGGDDGGGGGVVVVGKCWIGVVFEEHDGNDMMVAGKTTVWLGGRTAATN
jgi:hypothetical protein